MNRTEQGIRRYFVELTGVLITTRFHDHHTAGVQHATQFLKVIFYPAFFSSIAVALSDASSS